MLLLASRLPEWLNVVFVIAILLGMVFGALYFLRGYERWAKNSLERKYRGLALRSNPQEGDVFVQYHTYHGFIAWVTQTPHQFVASYEDARKLLGRLLRFNLTWGLFTYASLFAIPLALFNYTAQRRSIANQLNDGA